MQLSHFHFKFQAKQCITLPAHGLTESLNIVAVDIIMTGWWMFSPLYTGYLEQIYCILEQGQSPVVFPAQIIIRVLYRPNHSFPLKAHLIDPF